jgi:hypothetical protein
MKEFEGVGNKKEAADISIPSRGGTVFKLICIAC